MSRFHNALYMGNVEERVKVLKTSGQLILAYATAVVHGLHDQAEEIRKFILLFICSSSLLDHQLTNSTHHATTLIRACTWR